MLEGKTKSGFMYQIDEAIADDWEILEIINKCNDDASNLVPLSKMLLGEEQLEKLKEYCRDNGKILLSKMSEEISEILEGAVKNSQA